MDTPHTDDVHQADVKLAQACAAGDTEALARFDATYAPLMRAVARRFGSDDFATEVVQLVHRRLLVAEDAVAPRIAEYRGQGPLAGFVQAVTVRLALNLQKASGRHVAALGDDALLDTPAGDDDPELAAIKRRYRAEFKEAFAVAMASLEDAPRNALRLHYLDGLTLADLGRLYGWSVPTASRRLAAARETLLTATRRALGERLELTAAEVDSVLRLIESRLSVDGLSAT